MQLFLFRLTQITAKYRANLGGSLSLGGENAGC